MKKSTNLFLVFEIEWLNGDIRPLIKIVKAQ